MSCASGKACGPKRRGRRMAVRGVMCKRTVFGGSVVVVGDWFCCCADWRDGWGVRICVEIVMAEVS